MIFLASQDGDIIYSDWEMKTSSNEEKIASKFKFLSVCLNHNILLILKYLQLYSVFLRFLLTYSYKSVSLKTSGFSSTHSRQHTVQLLWQNSKLCSVIDSSLCTCWHKAWKSCFMVTRFAVIPTPCKQGKLLSLNTTPYFPLCVSHCEIPTERTSYKKLCFFIPSGKKCTIHKEAVNTVQRSPFFKDIILSVGGWNFAIWKEGVTVSYFKTSVK